MWQWASGASEPELGEPLWRLIRAWALVVPLGFEGHAFLEIAAATAIYQEFEGGEVYGKTCASDLLDFRVTLEF